MRHARDRDVGARRATPREPRSTYGASPASCAVTAARPDPSRDRRISVAGREESRGECCAHAGRSSFGVTDIPRKTNYDFERREREKTKAAETAKKAQAKADKRAVDQATPDADE